MPAATPPLALTIAGSDPSGGAGIQADLKTFEAHDVYGMSVVTALTAQNTLGVQGFEVVASAFVRQQLDAVADDIGVDAAKTGMLGSAEVMEAVAAGVRHHGIDTLVVDPVAASKHGDPLLEADALSALREAVLPAALVATPNLGEVELLTGQVVETVDDLPRAAEAMLGLGCRWVLVKGGHLPGDRATDLLTDGDRREWLTADRIEARDTHGTGCTLAAALTARLAVGDGLVTAAHAAKEYLTGALGHGVRIGAGVGPVDHRWRDR